MITYYTLVHFVEVGGDDYILDHRSCDLFNCFWFACEVGHVKIHQVFSLILLHGFRFGEAKRVEIFHDVGVCVDNIAIINGLDGAEVDE